MKKYLLTCCILFAVKTIHANNLQIGPATYSSMNGANYLEFNISWENSWRTSSAPFNWDAVWVFVKRRDCAGLQWRHANLAPQDTAHTAGAPLFVDAYADKKGVMIYRVADGSGSITNIAIRLKLDSVPPGNYDYQVFGIEMVYVPQGAFYLGDGVSTSTFKTATTNNPYFVASEAAIAFNTSGSNLFANQFGESGTIPAAFPKGFNTFYCMKYEISQGQYADFLNNLTQDAVANRYNSSYSNQNRYTISGSWPQLSAASPDRASNFLSFRDIAAFLDWCALSPMTETEFEKICRGPNIPVAGEYAWGGSGVTDADSLVNGTDGSSNEACANTISVGNGLANFGNDGVLGPLRCGFAAKSATTRFEAGAGYYGVMEMSGNVWERCYSVFFSQSAGAVGTNFNGSHGDGELASTPFAGFANQGWPIESTATGGNEVLSLILRGAGWSSTNLAELRISDRSNVGSSLAGADSNGRASLGGGRGVSRRQ